jgi:hypothetical protein
MARHNETTSGDQPRFDRGREGMGPEVCESATGYRRNVFPALATLPQHARPVGGPTGSGYPAAAGPASDCLRPALAPAYPAVVASSLRRRGPFAPGLPLRGFLFH